MRKVHILVGVLGIVIFLTTGMYMRLTFPAIYGADEALRYMYRANHVYLLLASLINLAIGIYAPSVARSNWARSFGLLGNVLVALSPAILTFAFFFEAPKASPDRGFTALGVFVALLGVLAQLPNARSAPLDPSDRR